MSEQKWQPEKALESLHDALVGLRRVVPDYRWKVLVVDDNRNDRLFLSVLLKDRCDVTECDEPEKAIALILKSRFDLVFLDIKMPPANGIKVLRIVKQQMPEQRFVIVSGYGDECLRNESLELGASLYLLKPVTQKQIEGIFGFIKG